MFHREAGVFKTTYASDMALYPLPIAKWTMVGLAVLFAIVLPMTLEEYYLSILNLIFIAVVGALGLNILVGYTGQISLGHGAFMSVGAYTAANLAVRLGLPLWLTLPAGGLMAAFIGALVGIPSLRIKGLYLAIATLAGQLIIEWTINHVPAISGGAQASIQVPRPDLFGFVLNTQGRLYYFLLFFAALAIVATLNLMRSRVGRAFIAVRDGEIAAQSLGIGVVRYKALAFAISGFYAGAAGALYAPLLGYVAPESFDLFQMIVQKSMIVVGGMGSIVGSVIGATVMVAVIELLREFKSTQEIVFGGILIAFVVFRPRGIVTLFRRIPGWDEPLSAFDRTRFPVPSAPSAPSAAPAAQPVAAGLVGEERQ